ncbi:hypothetical protein QVD17_15636 [Tagetes erecta]|uniref:Uncharacterized protein n=1 Tax=Tagetes erecta TaxID=13708 RepID=A0AAD8KQH2_TARER|nr:hypothetical protein QVD17_15636 [Tagetes erecta]
MEVPPSAVIASESRWFFLYHDSSAPPIGTVARKEYEELLVFTKSDLQLRRLFRCLLRRFLISPILKVS